MHADHQVFLDALHAKRRLSVSFFDKKENRARVCVCAPLDYGPLRGAAEPVEHYQLWDLERKRKPLNLALHESNIVHMQPLDATFEPADIITWAFKPNAWAVVRDWGEFS